MILAGKSHRLVAPAVLGSSLDEVNIKGCGMHWLQLHCLINSTTFVDLESTVYSYIIIMSIASTFFVLTEYKN